MATAQSSLLGASSPSSPGLGLFSADESAGGEPSIPGSNRRLPPRHQMRSKLPSSSATVSDNGSSGSSGSSPSSPFAARAWGDVDDDDDGDELPDGSTEDEDEDRRLEEADRAAASPAAALADSSPRASMARKPAMKQVEPSALAAGARKDKENAPAHANQRRQGAGKGLTADKDNEDATKWTSNVAKWQQRDGENVLTPRGSQRKTRAALAPASPATTASAGSSMASSLTSPPLISRHAAADAETARQRALDDALSFAIQMDPLYEHQATPMPAPLQPSRSMKSTAMRLMEHSPLLRVQSSLAEDPEWGPRALTETRPDLKEEFKSLCVLSYPVIFTYVLEFLPGIVSMTLVGHMDSPKTKEYVDGVSLSTMFMNLTGIAFGFGLATAMDTLCSQAYGAGKPMKMGIYFQCGILVLGVTVIPVFLLNWYTEGFLLMMGQPEEVAALAGRFSRLVLPGIPFLYVYELFKKLLQAQNVVTPMVYIAVLSNVVNVVLGVYLTWYTSLGYDGAAIARTISNVVLPAALVPFFMWNPDVAKQWWPGWKLSQAIRYMKTFLTLGIPGMFMMLLEWWAFEIMAAFVGLLPDSVVAISVHSVLSNVSTMTFNFFLGIAVATNIRVGNYVGSNQPEHAKMASALGIVLSLLVSAALALVVLVTRNVLPMVFINDATSVTLAAHAFLYLMPYQMLDAVNSVMQGVFRGTGRQKLGAYINLFGYFAVGLPFGVYLAFTWNYGVEGLWLGLTSGIGIGVLASMYKIYYIDWDEMADAARVRTS